MLVYTLFKSKSRKRDLGFFFAVFGLTLIIETVLYIFLSAYEYFPHIIPNSPKNDGVVGNIISQFSISTVALLICVYNVPLRGITFAALVFFFIENFFLYLGIYKTNWYKPWMTLVFFVILFLTLKAWYKAINTIKSSIIAYITSILGIIALYLPTTNWIGILSGCFEIRDNLLMDPYISHAVITIPKYLLQIHAVYFFNRYKASWLWYVSAAAVFVVLDTILYHTHLMYVKDGWLLIYSGISLSTTYLYVLIMDRLLQINSEKVIGS